jgi:hypothetical protein
MDANQGRAFFPINLRDSSHTVGAPGMAHVVGASRSREGMSPARTTLAISSQASNMSVTQ